MSRSYEVQGLVHDEWHWMHAAGCRVRVETHYVTRAEAESVVEQLVAQADWHPDCLRIVEVGS